MDSKFCTWIPTGDIGQFDRMQCVFESCIRIILDMRAAPIDLKFRAQNFIGVVVLNGFVGVPERCLDFALGISDFHHDEDNVVGLGFELIEWKLGRKGGGISGIVNYAGVLQMEVGWTEGWFAIICQCKPFAANQLLLCGLVAG